MSPRRRRRPGEAGLIRGCLGLLLLLALLGSSGTTYVLIRATTAPDLGAAPLGTNHGDTEAAIAAYTVTTLASLLLPGHPHQAVRLSEHDMTVEIAAHLPPTDELRDPQARIRDGRLLVSGQTSLGPIGVVGVGRLGLHLTLGPDGLPDIAADIQEIDAGSLTLPAPVRNAIADRIDRAFDLNDLLVASPELTALRGELECVTVQADAVVIGFHAVDAGPDRATCG